MTVNDGTRHKPFAPAVARRLPWTVDFHDTSVHGSWLGLSELELSMLSRLRLAGCIAVRDTLIPDVAVDDARRKPHRLYPS